MITGNTTSYLKNCFFRFTVPLIMVCVFSVACPLVYAQKVPTVKVEKKKKVKRPAIPKKPKTVKDKYKRPITKSRPEKSRDRYRRPPSQKIRYHNTDARDQKLSSPGAEEGGSIPRLSFWQRIFNRDKPSRYRGRGKSNPVQAGKGTRHDGKIKTLPHGQVSKQLGYKAQYLANYQGNGKALKPERQDRKLQNTSSDLQQAGLYKKKKTRKYERASEDVHQHRGNIRQAPPKQVHKQFGYKAQYMASFQGHQKVLKPQREQKRLSGMSDDMQKAGLYKVRKEKDQAASYTSYAGKMKVPTLAARTRNHKKLSVKVHQYDGNIRYRKPGKDMHPSVYYLKSKTKNSYEQKENYRRWRLVLMHIFDKKDQPKHTKEKPRKPRYDKDESEIWYY